jgi:hypothetical protein
MASRAKPVPRRPTHLVTFCNVGRGAFALLDAEGILETRAVDMAGLGRNAGGIVGAAFHEGRCYLAVQSHPPAIAVFDDDWTQVDLFEPGGIKDIHGLAVHDGSLLIASTGTNQIVACDLATGALRPFWSDPAALSDTVHVNDIAAEGGRVVASRFGPRRSDGQRSGDVFDVLTGETLVAAIREPHSVVLVEGTVHVLESPTGDLVRCHPGFSPRRLYGIVGYARGLAVGRTTVAIGKSGYRRQSRQGIGDSRLAPFAPTQAAEDAQALSGVFMIDRVRGESHFIDTNDIGPEVYAVVGLPEGILPASDRAGAAEPSAPPAARKKRTKRA